MLIPLCCFSDLPTMPTYLRHSSSSPSASAPPCCFPRTQYTRTHDREHNRSTHQRHGQSCSLQRSLSCRKLPHVSFKLCQLQHCLYDETVLRSSLKTKRSFNMSDTFGFSRTFINACAWRSSGDLCDTSNLNRPQTAQRMPLTSRRSATAAISMAGTPAKRHEYV